MSQLSKHYDDACAFIPEDRIIGVFYQGSGNYGLDYEGSDVDTKCVIAPSLQDLAKGTKMSVTRIRNNDEHIDIKDIRLMMEVFRKCNLNFLEILYSNYYILNPMYEELWGKILAKRDEIIANGGDALVKSMVGIAREKYHALEHRYPSRIEWLDKYGYDPKQLHHLFRIEEFMQRWQRGESFAECLISKKSEWLISVKRGETFDLDGARKFGKESLEHIEKMYKEMKTDLPANDDYYECFAEIILEMVKRSVSREICFG